MIQDNIEVILDYNTRPRSKRARRKAAQRIRQCAIIAVARRYVFAIDPVLYNRLTYAIYRRVPSDGIYDMMLAMSPYAIVCMNRLNLGRVYHTSEGALYMDTVRGKKRLAYTNGNAIVSPNTKMLEFSEVYIVFGSVAVRDGDRDLVHLRTHYYTGLAILVTYTTLVVSFIKLLIEEYTWTTTHAAVTILRVLTMYFIIKVVLRAPSNYKI